MLSTSSHPIKRILASRQPGMVLLKYLLLCVLVLQGLVSVGVSAQSLTRSLVYRKDFSQDYLLVKAVIEGVNPYLPLRELAALVIGPSSHLGAWYPTPHPPPVAVFSLPLGLIAYEQAAAAWFLFEIACFFASTYLLLRCLDKQPTLISTALATLFVLGWRHSFDELVTGQLNSLLLVLLLGSWQALRSHKETLGGALLGCMVALKLMAWPILFFLALRRNWRAVGAAGMVVVATNIAAAMLIGFDKVIYYYSEVGGNVASLFRAYYWNISVWSIGWRLFEGTGSPVASGMQAPPIMTTPGLALFLSYFLPVALLIVGLVLSTRARSFDASFGMLVCVSIVINPVAWSHYLLFALAPMVVAGRYLAALDFPRTETFVALAVGALLTLTSGQLHDIAVPLGGQDPQAAVFTVPFWVALIPLVVPLAGTLGLLWLVWHLDRAYSEKDLRAVAERNDDEHSQSPLGFEL